MLFSSGAAYSTSSELTLSLTRGRVLSFSAVPYHSITVRKSKYDLGKKFFTNITPGYQLYPAVFLMPWTDPNAPDDYFLFMYTCRTGQIVRFTSDGNFLPMWDM